MTEAGALTVADLEAAGFTHVRAECATCHHLTYMPFRMLRMQGTIGDNTTLQSLGSRFRCKSCGGTAAPQSIRPWYQYMGTPQDTTGGEIAARRREILAQFPAQQ